MALLDDVAVRTARAANFAEDGYWPIAGGWLDQTQSVIDAIAYLRVQENRIREERRSDGD